MPTKTKKLFIVESPAKAKTVSKYIGDDYVVRASVGHIRDLPKSSKNAIDIEKGFIPHYVISPGKEKVVSDLKKLASNTKEILLATDPDREGEAIAWHLSELLGTKNIKRITYNEITKEAVQEALKHPRDIDINLKEAQEARRVLDRLFGYDLSGLIWKKVRYGLSAGRVQSPALRILMEREREIRAFNPETFWTITADVTSPSKENFLLICAEEPRDKERLDFIIKEGNKEKWIVEKIKESNAKRSPRPPFITSTLQQTASTRLGFSPSRTMGIAQKLYEAGHITYMRTDSPNLSTSAMNSSATQIKKLFGEKYYQRRAFKAKGKNAQEAHEAIRPTHLEKKEAGLTTEQRELYRLIWSRTIASQMSDAQMIKTKITVKVGNHKDMPLFSVNGSRYTFDGWLKADPASKRDDVEVPKIEQGDVLTLKDLNSEEKQTQPPSRYSEAGLIKELEKRGIGRPSTYASIIKTLDDRGYVTKEGRTLFPTDTGDVVSSFLEDNFSEYISDSFTAEMENNLDDIAEGKKEYVKTLKDFYTPFTKDIASKENIEKITDLGPADKKFKCPKCKASMVIKLGRAGKFLSCSTYPDCDGALTLEGKEIAGDTPIGTHPDTNEPIFVKVGRFGPYVQQGEKIKGSKEKPRMASIPKGKDPEKVTLEEALVYLSLPRDLGKHPDTGEKIIANNGRFGPYIAHDGEFRSIKAPDDVYTITKERAIQILSEPKPLPKGVTLFKELGKHPKTGKKIDLLESKKGVFLKKGLRRIFIPDHIDPNTMTVDDVVKLLG